MGGCVEDGVLKVGELKLHHNTFHLDLMEGAEVLDSAALWLF